MKTITIKGIKIKVWNIQTHDVEEYGMIRWSFKMQVPGHIIFDITSLQKPRVTLEDLVEHHLDDCDKDTLVASVMEHKG